MSSPFTIDAVGVYELGDGSYALPSTHIIQFVGSTFTGSMVPQMKIRGPANDAAAYTNIPYARRTLGGVAQDDTVVIAALTADYTIKIDSSGGKIALNVTALSAGTGKVYWAVVAGPDA